MPYNISYINEFNEQSYLKVLSDKKMLEMLLQNHIYRLDVMRPYYAAKDLFKESLDHYVTKQYEENPNFRTSKEFNNYLNYLSDLLNRLH